jgi:hypothetical protein
MNVDSLSEKEMKEIIVGYEQAIKEIIRLTNSRHLDNGTIINKIYNTAVTIDYESSFKHS